MSAPAVLLVGLIALAGGTGLGLWLSRNGHVPGRERREAVRHILFPFTIYGVSGRALDAAVRLALAEHAILMPAYLATVPLHLPIEAAMPRQYGEAMPILDLIEERATREGVTVDSRVTRGRSVRDALAQLLEREDFDRVVVSAAALGESGFKEQDVAWLLEHVPTEVVVLRPGTEDRRMIAPRQLVA